MKEEAPLYVKEEKKQERTPQPGDKVMIGKIVRKIPWTRRSVEEKYEMISLLPTVTESIMWNGVKYNVFRGIETKLPVPHYEMYMERRKMELNTPSGNIIIGGMIISVSPSAGLEGMPTDPERGKLNAESLFPK